MQLSQLPLVQIVKFQCLSNREFPEFFKTHPTYISRSILKGSRSLQTKTGHFYFPRLYLLLNCFFAGATDGVRGGDAGPPAPGDAARWSPGHGRVPLLAADPALC